MNATTHSAAEPELRHPRIGDRDARVAVFKRTYHAPVEDVWDACTNPDRLRRWYLPITATSVSVEASAKPPWGPA